MAEYDPGHEEIEITRKPAAIEGVTVYTVQACRSGCVLKGWSKALAENNRANIVTTIGELVLQGFEVLDDGD